MERINLTPKQEELIERFGVFLERSGTAPAQARIIALLYISDATELTFEEIYNTLRISKSSASTAINALLVSERIEYKTRPGDRRRYFTSRISQFEADFEGKFSKILVMNTYLKEILDSRTKDTPEFNASFERVIGFLDFLQQELPGLYKKWRKQNPISE